MNARRVPYCSTCKKQLTTPAIRLSCESAGHTLTTKAQKLASTNGAWKRCRHARDQWNDCECPWYYNVTVKGKVHRGLLGKFEHRLAAQAAAAAVKERLHDGQPAQPSEAPRASDTDTVETFANHWLEHATELKASTARFYRDHLDNHIIPLLGQRPVADIKRTDIKRLIEALTAKKLKPPTIGGVVRTLSRVLSEAVEEERLAANPAFRPGLLHRKLRDPNAPKRTEIDPYTREEAQILTETARKHFPAWYPFLLCALRTGMRLGELRALQWGQIDWRNSFISVERNFVEGVTTTPKNGKTRRVDMSPQLRTALRLWRWQQRAPWFARGLRLPQIVFPSSVGTPHDDSKIRKAMVDIVTKAEVRRRPSIIHVLRHTFASLHLQQGESLAYVRDQMGHGSIQVTVDVYGHLVPGGNRQAAARLDDEVERRGALQESA